MIERYIINEQWNNVKLFNICETGIPEIRVRKRFAEMMAENFQNLRKNINSSIRHLEKT